MAKCGDIKPGWFCSRDQGHGGPCAAWPTGPEQLPEIDEDSDMTIECLKMAEELLKRHLALHPDAENRMLEIALDFVERGRLNHMPPPLFGGPGPAPAFIFQ